MFSLCTSAGTCWISYTDPASSHGCEPPSGGSHPFLSTRLDQTPLGSIPLLGQAVNWWLILAFLEAGLCEEDELCAETLKMAREAHNTTPWRSGGGSEGIRGTSSSRAVCLVHNVAVLKMLLGKLCSEGPHLGRSGSTEQVTCPTYCF